MDATNKKAEHAEQTRSLCSAHVTTTMTELGSAFQQTIWTGYNVVNPPIKDPQWIPNFDTNGWYIKPSLMAVVECYYMLLLGLPHMLPPCCTMLNHITAMLNQPASCEPGSSSPGSPSLAARSWERPWIFHQWAMDISPTMGIRFLGMHIGELDRISRSRTAWACYDQFSACFDTHITAGSFRKASMTYFLKTEIRVQKVRLHLALSRNLSGTEWGYLLRFPQWPGVSFWLLSLRVVGPDMDRMDPASSVTVRLVHLNNCRTGMDWSLMVTHWFLGVLKAPWCWAHSYFRLRATFPTQKRSNSCRLRGQVAPSHPSPSTDAAPCESLLKDGDPSRGQGWCPCRAVPNRRYGQHFFHFFHFLPCDMGEDAYVPTKITKKVGIQVIPAASADGWLGGNAVKACKKKTNANIEQCDLLRLYLHEDDYIHAYIYIYIIIYIIIYIYI